MSGKFKIDPSEYMPEEKIVEAVKETQKVKSEETIINNSNNDVAKSSEKSEKSAKKNTPIKKNNLVLKKEKGTQKTIYFKAEIFRFCESIAEENSVGISDVVNAVIAEYIKIVKGE